MKFRKPKHPATKIIEFRLKETLDPAVYKLPTPSKLNIPKWFEEMPPYLDGDSQRKLNPSNLTGKHCVPIMDGFTAGYQALTPYELQVDYIKKLMSDEMKNDPQISLPIDEPEVQFGYPGFPIIEKRSRKLAEHFPAPSGYHDGVLVWRMWFQIITPPGYSVFITHPLNRFDLPFITASAVVDADKNGGLGGPVPVYFKKDFSGFLPLNTPLMQIIPFKRENWKSQDLGIKELLFSGALSETDYGHYKKTKWTPKKYD
jgi:hypothetical protein